MYQTFPTTEDYVIVKFADKSKMHNYIGTIIGKVTVEILRFLRKEDGEVYESGLKCASCGSPMVQKYRSGCFLIVGANWRIHVVSCFRVGWGKTPILSKTPHVYEVRR